MAQQNKYVEQVYRGLKGVWSNEDPLFLDPDALVDVHGFLPIKGQLVSGIDVLAFANAPVASTLDGTVIGVFVQGIDVPQILMLTSHGSVYTGTLTNIPPNPPFYRWTGPVTFDTPITPSFLRFVGAQGNFYTTARGLNKIYKINSANAITIDTAYLGGAYIYELAGHLCVANVDQGGNFPQRVAWSPSGQFNIFDPTVNIGAGFQDLTDVPDFISGVMSFGQVAYLFRGSGITVQYPLVTGTAPFDFQHLTTAMVGVGNTGEVPVVSYGNIGVFKSLDNFYSMDISGNLTAIGGMAYDAIVADVPQDALMLPFNGDILYIVKCLRDVSWVYSFKYQAWHRINSVLPQITKGYVITASNYDLATAVYLGSGSTPALLYCFPNSSTGNADAPTFGNSDVTYRQEDPNLQGALQTVSLAEIVGSGQVTVTLFGLDINGVATSSTSQQVTLHKGRNYVRVPPITVIFPQMKIDTVGQTVIRRAKIKMVSAQGDLI